MRINLLGFVLIQADESVQDIIASQSIIFTTFVIREVVLHRAGRKLLLETIDFVQEKNNGGLDKPSGVANRVE